MSPHRPAFKVKTAGAHGYIAQFDRAPGGRGAGKRNPDGTAYRGRVMSDALVLQDLGRVAVHIERPDRHSYATSVLALREVAPAIRRAESYGVGRYSSPNSSRTKASSCPRSAMPSPCLARFRT